MKHLLANQSLLIIRRLQLELWLIMIWWLKILTFWILYIKLLLLYVTNQSVNKVYLREKKTIWWILIFCIKFSRFIQSEANLTRTICTFVVQLTDTHPCPNINRHIVRSRAVLYYCVRSTSSLYFCATAVLHTRRIVESFARITTSP